VASGDCSFEFDTCGWKSINPGSALDLRPQDWKLADRIQKFGSFRDHTFKLDTGGYAYFDTINIQTKTWLISPRLAPDQPLCLQFYFATAASDTSNLQLRRQFANGTMGELWGVQFSDLELPEGTTVSTWLPAQVYIPALASDSALVFEGNSNDGGFALDDITLKPVADMQTCRTRPEYTSTFQTRTNPFLLASQTSHQTSSQLTRLQPIPALALFSRQSKALPLPATDPVEEEEEVEEGRHSQSN